MTAWRSAQPSPKMRAALALYLAILTASDALSHLDVKAQGGRGLRWSPFRIGQPEASMATVLKPSLPSKANEGHLQEEEEDDEAGEGDEGENDLEGPSLLQLAEEMRQKGQISGGSLEEQWSQEVDATGIEVIGLAEVDGPSRVGTSALQANPSLATDGILPPEELAAPETGEEAGGDQRASRPGRWQRINMSTCGGAPDSMVPFDRSASPWGTRKSVQGLLYQAPSPGRRRLAGLEVTDLEELAAPDEAQRLLYSRRPGWEKNLSMAARNSSWDRVDAEEFDNEARRPQRTVLAAGLSRRAQHHAARQAQRVADRRKGSTLRTTGGAFGRGTEDKRSGCKKEAQRVPLENNGFGRKVPVSRRAGDAVVLGCLKDPKKCTKGAYTTAKRLQSTRVINRVPKFSLGKRRFRSCALVGNAGHMIKKKYGAYIDRHEAVIRFNTADMKAFAAHVGRRTTFRVLNNAESRAACCRGSLPEKKSTKIGLILWYPGAMKEMKQSCTKKWPMHTVHQLSLKFMGHEIRAMNALRAEAQRMGLGRELGEWKQISTGGHAVLLFNKVCDSISLYGFTTWPTRVRNDHYYRSGGKQKSGIEWHDWGGEALAWRLMHVSGQATICSN